LSEGRLVHAHIDERGFTADRIVRNTLVDMYAKCGSLLDARRVFDQMPERDVLSWTVMIKAYARHGFAEDALSLFYHMLGTGVQPNQFTFASILPVCASVRALDQGIQIHQEIDRSGFQCDLFVANALIDMYAKCNRMENARDVFEKMLQRDVVSWTALVAGYAQNGYIDEASRLFQIMPERNLVSWNAMIAGYLRNGHVDEAMQLFQKLPGRDVVSWTAMMAGYAQNGYGMEALKLFGQMKVEGMKPDSMTYASVVSACAGSASIERGMEIHGEIIKSGFLFDVLVANALIDVYAKSGSMEKAYNVFEGMSKRDMVSWNTMIAGHVQDGDMQNAMMLFQEMPKQNVVSWTTMVAGYVQNGQSVKALELFQQMQLEDVKPDSNTFASVLSACADLAALEQGMEIHEEIVRSEFQSNLFVANALVDMYAKSGNVGKARDLFDNMHQRDVVSWTTMIAGYAMHGCAKEALKLFQQMQKFDVKPNRATLVCVLSACCHAGLVDEGRQYFDCMSKSYHIVPSMEHYGCMVDLLVRAGQLIEAQNFINRMPIKPDATVWGCLLAGCRIHNNIELAECVAECLFELDPKNAAPYVLLSNMYAAVGRGDGIEMVRRMMKERGVEKMPGCSWIEINKQVHVFLIGDR
jgi:pentatricopeptide repeat protein